MAKAKKEKPAPAPNGLVRESAGVYRTGDGRFEVQKSDLGWFLVDTEQANEFGQQLIHGPLSTLDVVREQIPGARDIKPLLRVRPIKGSPAKDQAKPQKPAPPPPPPPTWIDRLPDEEAADVRRLIRVLEREGLKDAEELVKRHRDDVAPLIASRLVEHRLRALVDEQPVDERARAQALIRRATEILTSDGTAVPKPAPRWALVELKPEDPIPARRMRPQA
jgi:hypothetical protein